MFAYSLKNLSTVACVTLRKFSIVAKMPQIKITLFTLMYP